MSIKSGVPRTEGSARFNPDVLFEIWDSGQKTLPTENDLRSSIISTFGLAPNDNYVYHAIASVTLAQVQTAIHHGSESGMHAWYHDDMGHPLPPPPQNDIQAYAAIFAAHTSPSKVLTGFSANAKRDSIRSQVASNLQAKRLLPAAITIPKSKKHVNPYYDFWVWSCLNLEWAGPVDSTEKIKISHHILPVFMHHFSCVVPSHESLEIVKHFAGIVGRKDKRVVVEVGSGNGYWTCMLRRMGLEVRAVDNHQSDYRTKWIGDTIIADGEKHLQTNNGCRDEVLLLVYPVIGADFTHKILKAYNGDTVIVAGTQNANGYTAFKDRTIDDYVQVEQKHLVKVVQIPLPSFAGKDEALYVFERKG